MIDKNSLITAYLLCFPERTLKYAENYLSDLEQYKFIVYGDSQSNSHSVKCDSICTESSGDSALIAPQSRRMTIAFIIYRTIDLDEAEIIDIGVIPERRNQGFGAKILNEMEFKLKKLNVKKIHLEFREDNFPAEKLYRKLGYIKVGERKNYYKDMGKNPKNAVLMTKFI